MKTKLFFLLIAVILFSCKSEAPNFEESKEEPGLTNENVSANEMPGVVEGVVRVKLTSKLGDNLTVTNDGGSLRSSGGDDLNNILQELGATGMTRVFPHAGIYEERSRKEGMHLWYEIAFDKSKPVTRAARSIQSIEGIEIVEEVLQPVLAPYSVYPINESSTTRAATDFPFNDRLFAYQWHYYNDGSRTNFSEGADINLLPAWEISTGSSNVIVSVVDGGIDVNHEDLKDNLWINQAELNGRPGVDDDNNGYIDDVYGNNFSYAATNGRITADSHGTHVAGTVSARNNNGIGLCGVAGGNGRAGSGARLMSCQIFQTSMGGNSAAAIKYGADNGAIISQNSWGYVYPGPRSMPASDRAAIDYFIRYAGCDASGNQRADSPMKGGVVIFAAGNDNADYLAYPAAYSPVIAVSSMAPNFKRARYTNRGNWVDIMAPGGDSRIDALRVDDAAQVASTLPNNRYGYMEGTSMACPHVSGIAALIISRFGGRGFTNQQLETRLLNAIKDVNIYDENPDYEGRLGRGYIDAQKALSAR